MVKGQVFNVPFSALDWRLDHVYDFESQCAGSFVYFCNDAQPLRAIAYDTAAANFSTTHLKLRFD